MKNILFSAFVLSVFALASCTKKNTVSDYPSLTITSPTTGQSFTGGTTIHVMGTATASGTDDAHLLHELSLKVKEHSGGNTIWMADFSVHDLESFTIDTSFTLPTPSAQQELELEAEVVNHLTKSTDKTVSFTVHP